MILISVTLFSVGLALYANTSTSMSALSGGNIEALTEDVETYGGPYMVYGSYPTRIIVDNITHVVIFEGKTQDKDGNGHPINACTEDTKGSCTVNTSETVYNTGVISSYVQTFFQGLANAVNIISMIMALVN